MGRTAKKTQADAGLQAEMPIIELEPPIPSPVVKETYRVVRTWQEEKPIEEIDDDEPKEIDDDEPEEMLPSPDDPIAKVLSEIAGSRSTWSLQVARLPNYDRDNRTDPKSRRHCGVLSIPDADYLKEERYLEDLQHKFARGQNGNWFLMCVRRDNRNFAYLSPVCVEPPLPELMAAKAAENPGVAGINIYNPAAPPADGFKQFVAQAKQFAELRDLLFPSNGNSLPPSNNSHNEPLTDERALLHILNRDEGVVDSVARKLRGLLKGDGSTEEKGPWDAVVALLTSPTLPQTIQMLAAQFRAPQQHQATGNQPPDSPPPMPADVAAQQRLLIVLTNAMRLNSDVATVLPALDGFTELFPEHRGMIEQFLTAETQQLLDALPQFYPPSAQFVGLPHAAEWVEKLKALYFGEQSELEGSQQ